MNVRKTTTSIAILLLVAGIGIIIFLALNKDSSPPGMQTREFPVQENTRTLLSVNEFFKNAVFVTEEPKTFNIEKLDAFIENMKKNKTDILDIIVFNSVLYDKNECIESWYSLSCANKKVRLVEYKENDNGIITSDEPVIYTSISHNVDDKGNIVYTISDENGNTLPVLNAPNPVAAPKSAEECVEIFLNNARSGSVFYYLASENYKEEAFYKLVLENWVRGNPNTALSNFEIINSNKDENNAELTVREIWKVSGLNASAEVTTFTLNSINGRWYVDKYSS